VGDDFNAGDLLTLEQGGFVETVATTIDSNLAIPIRFIALEDFDGVTSVNVGVQSITADTKFLGQVSTSTVTVADIGKRGTLAQDVTTGNYHVVITDTKPVVEIVDVEPNFSPEGRYATGNYNLVLFKFLPAALEKAPATSST